MSAWIIRGDALRLPLGDETVDACVTDPPYGLEFMGKKWDRLGDVGQVSHSGPTEWDGTTVFGRQRVAYNGSANSRCLNCGKWKWGHTTGDQGGGGKKCECDTPTFPSVANHQARLMQDWHYQWATEALRVAKPGTHLLAFGGTRTYHRLTCAIEDAGWEIRDCLSWLYGSGFPKSRNFDGAWQGWGTALKPSWEPIILARKPLTGTVAANVQKWGTGALNIEASRVGTFVNETPSGADRFNARNHELGYRPNAYQRGREGEASAERRYTNKGGTNFAALPGPRGGDTAGRWPPNLLLGCCGLDPHDAGCPVRVLDEQSGELGISSGGRIHSGVRSPEIYGADHRVTIGDPGFGDSGGASRFFPIFESEPPFLYVPKASRGERESGAEHLARRQRDESREPDAPGANNPRNRGGQLRANSHPTVKPIALMRWLIRLITPPGGTVLDMFLGSGTTGSAAIDLGFDFIGVEKEADYVNIARARIEGRAPLFSGVA